MRALLIATSFLLASSTLADAASGGRAPRDPSQLPAKETSDEISKKAAAYLKQCLDDWDAATHMTKQEWRTTCERVVRERSKWLREQAADEKQATDTDKKKKKK
jgi:hypothetical protein